MLATGLSFSQIRQGAATLENAPVNPEN
jgi:hypothetical protein